MSSLGENARKKPYWRSLAELENTPEFEEFLHREFPKAASEFPEGVSRRRWLQVMGASFALAGVSGCRWEEDHLLPLSARPMGRVPGVPAHYATAMEISGVASGLLVTSYDGRPTKIEGNPEHPQNQGASEAYAQASTLELYDPDRNSGVLARLEGEGDSSDNDSWAAFEDALQAKLGDLSAASGRGLRVLAEPSSSPTLAKLRARLAEAFPEAKWVDYEPLNSDNELAASMVAFGEPMRTQLEIAAATTILCLDADLLSDDPSSIRHAREYAGRRDPDGDSMVRLYAVESTFSTTGAMADHRLAIRSKQILALSLALEAAISHRLDAAEVEKYGKLSEVPAGGFLEEEPIAAFVEAVADDLVEHRGQGIVAVGPRQPKEVHIVAHRLNQLLGNVGKTVRYTGLPKQLAAPQTGGFRELCKEMQDGSVDTLVILGGNPVYDAPADCNFANGLSKVEFAAHLSHYDNETSRICHWHLPRAHYLESWGDALASDGTYSIVQPLILPLYDGKTPNELVAMLLGDTPTEAQDVVRETFAEVAGDNSDAKWRQTLHDGVLRDSQWQPAAPELRAEHLEVLEAADAAKSLSAEPAANGELEIVFCRDASVYDGRFANSSWLQELPDFMTKVTWDNVAMLSMATAEALGVENETLVRLTYKDAELTIPAYIMPGHADGSVSIHLGYGRTAAGLVGGSVEDDIEPVGQNAYKLRRSDAMGFDTGLSIEATDKAYALASTQDHHLIDEVGTDGRDERLGQIVREATLDEYKHHPDFAAHAVHSPELKSLWEEPQREADHKWGMAIDLNKCTGCSACVVACQSENNIPVVGAEQVRRGREMHWLRIDRYFQGDIASPTIMHQPMTCQQCENAPCEQVCPVGATMHSAEGLNDMVYNRCVGTRYCANNCPYKVRRFNYFNFQKREYGEYQNSKDPKRIVLQMAQNPEVTIRSRGVMEKCTFCVQRIQAAKIEANNDGHRPIADGRIKTACQQVCASGAIVFGDLADPQSKVTDHHKSPRAYALLGELNVKPRNLFLARVRNPNPKLEPETADEHSSH